MLDSPIRAYSRLPVFRQGQAARREASGIDEGGTSASVSAARLPAADETEAFELVDLKRHLIRKEQLFRWLGSC